MTEDMTMYYEFLDNLRESGYTNMFGAGPYLMDNFGITKYEANRILTSWMQTYGERHG
tara:strand:- start:3511 stop:3684 length:174 start_codon:yes stop_codon:yes gene_type:complete